MGFVEDGAVSPGYAGASDTLCVFVFALCVLFGRPNSSKEIENSRKFQTGRQLEGGVGGKSEQVFTAGP